MKAKTLHDSEIKPIIEVENYLYDGNIIYGVRCRDMDDSWILDDGDIFSTKYLKEEYKVRFFTCEELFQKGRKQIFEDILNVIDKLDWNEIEFEEEKVDNFGTGHYFPNKEQLKKIIREKLLKWKKKH